MVGSQTASLTPGPSFAHNLGDRSPNAQCEGIFDIYASRPFQWHQEHPNERCFGSCCRAMNIRESRRTPNPPLFQVLGFTPTLGQVRVATIHDVHWFVWLIQQWTTLNNIEWTSCSKICGIINLVGNKHNLQHTLDHASWVNQISNLCWKLGAWIWNWKSNWIIISWMQGATSITIHTFYEVATQLLRYTWEQPIYMV